MNTYGIENFTFEILEKCKKELGDVEYIDTFKYCENIEYIFDGNTEDEIIESLISFLTIKHDNNLNKLDLMLIDKIIFYIENIINDLPLSNAGITLTNAGSGYANSSDVTVTISGGGGSGGQGGSGATSSINGSSVTRAGGGASGGGGGFLTAGADAPSGSVGGNGGDGAVSSITGSSVYYSGGGGGSLSSAGGTGNEGGYSPVEGYAGGNAGGPGGGAGGDRPQPANPEGAGD